MGTTHELCYRAAASPQLVKERQGAASSALEWLDRGHHLSTLSAPMRWQRSLAAALVIPFKHTLQNITTTTPAKPLET